MKAFQIVALSAVALVAGIGGACLGQIAAIGWDAWSVQIAAEIAALLA